MLNRRNQTIDESFAEKVEQARQSPFGLPPQILWCENVATVYDAKQEPDQSAFYREVAKRLRATSMVVP